MSVREDKHATDAGLTPAQKKAADKVESSIRNRKTEVAYAIDSNGNAIRVSTKGTSNRASVRIASVPRDAVLTHNHPSDYDRPFEKRTRTRVVRGIVGGGQGMGARIGSSITGDDIRLAILTDAKEVRAVGPEYTFSIRRPANGWGVNSEAFLREWYDEVNTYRANNQSYARSGREQLGRYNAVMAHSVTRKLAKKYGMTYTRKKA